MDLDVCSKYRELTPEALLIKCRRPVFMTCVHCTVFSAVTVFILEHLFFLKIFSFTKSTHF